MAKCMLCVANGASEASSIINVGKTGSTGHLTQHLNGKHRTLARETMEGNAREELNKQMGTAVDPANNSNKKQRTINDYGTVAPDFGKCLLRLVVNSYLPYNFVERKDFRDLCKSLNPKADSILIGRDKFKLMVMEETSVVKVLVEMELRDKDFAITYDGWTSECNMVSFLGMTVHWVDKKWILQSCPIGCFPKEGRSRAEDYMPEITNALAKFNLSLKKCVSAVTDTEAVMGCTGKLVEAASRNMGGNTVWAGCIAHQLELTTGIAFRDTEHSEGTLSAARALVGHFSHSSQAVDHLLQAQRGNQDSTQHAVKPTQDVTSRWWSTYQMLERLLRLKPYFAVMVSEE